MRVTPAGRDRRRADDVQARRHRSDEDAALVGGAAAPGAQGRSAAAHQLDGGRLQLVFARVPAAVRACTTPRASKATSSCGSAGTASRIPASGRTTCTWAAGSRWPTALGPFGNPTSDSARTMVTTATTQALLVVFAPHELGRAQAGAGARRDGAPDGGVHRLRARPRGRVGWNLTPMCTFQPSLRPEGAACASAETRPEAAADARRTADPRSAASMRSCRAI